MSIALDATLLVTGWIHVILAPYTKVEESFNLHAIHDVLMYGIHPSALSKFDHFVFPGAVPRTFVGSVLLGWLTRPAWTVAQSFNVLHSKSEIQILLRLILATTNALGLVALRRAVSRRYGRLTGLLYTLISISQFHIPFWMGRTIPNMFALPFVTFAYALITSRNPNSTRPSVRSVSWAVGLITAAAVIFRAELVLLLGPLALQFLIMGYISFFRLVSVGLSSGLLSLATTVLVDSYFWSKWPLWPEFAGIYFNVYQNKSEEWGVSPPSTYFASFLPKLLLSALPLSIPALLHSRHRVRELIIPLLTFVACLSALGHKEWRFIVYVVPVWNIIGARGAATLLTLPKGSLLGRVAFLIVFASIIGNLALTTLQTSASIHNYAGGDALELANKIFKPASGLFSTTPVHLHISNLAAQTGASLFLQTHALPSISGNLSEPFWVYDKTEGLFIKDLTLDSKYTHIITEAPCSNVDGWVTAAEVAGFDRWDLVSELKQLRKTGKTLEGLRATLVRALTLKKSVKLCLLART